MPLDAAPSAAAAGAEASLGSMDRSAQERAWPNMTLLHRAVSILPHQGGREAANDGEELPMSSIGSASMNVGGPLTAGLGALQAPTKAQPSGWVFPTDMLRDNATLSSTAAGGAWGGESRDCGFSYDASSESEMRGAKVRFLVLGLCCLLFE